MTTSDGPNTARLKPPRVRGLVAVGVVATALLQALLAVTVFTAPDGRLLYDLAAHVRSPASAGPIYSYDATAGTYDVDASLAQPVLLAQVSAVDSTRPATGPSGASVASTDALHAPMATPRLNLDRIRVTDGGVDVVERHLHRFVEGGSLDAAEAGMLASLRKIGAGDLAPTAQT